MIGIDGLCLAVPSKILFQHFTALIKSGEKIGIFGPNGAGKSTFLKALLGLVPVKAGSIKIDHALPAAARRQIAYLPQDFAHLPADYSVSGFLKALPGGKKGARTALTRVGALHLEHQRFKNLSGGERKRVMLAALFLETPRLVLLDEPFANLDPRYQQELLLLIMELQATMGFTLLMTAHDFNPLLAHLDRVMFIGKEEAVLDTQEAVIATDVLSELYGTSLEVVEVKGRKWVLSGESPLFMNPEHCHGGSCVSV